MGVESTTSSYCALTTAAAPSSLASGTSTLVSPHPLSSQEDSGAPSHIKQTDSGASISRYIKPDKMSVWFLVSSSDAYSTQHFQPSAPGTSEQSTKSVSISRNFKQRPSDTYPIYWVKPKVGTHRNNAARSGPVRSHIMREFHHLKPRKGYSTLYSQDKCLKLLAPKRQSVSPDVPSMPEL